MSFTPHRSRQDKQMRDISETDRSAEAAELPAICESEVPLDAAMREDTAIAVITGTEGPSYRPVGAAMVIGADGVCTGSLSSGCLESDVALQAQAALKDGRRRKLRYGRGSPFIDIALPCGGALDIEIIPHPDRDPIARARKKLAQRDRAELRLRSGTGIGTGDTADLLLHILPQTRFAVLGKGPETICFATLARGAGYPVELYSPDAETLEKAGFGTTLSGTQWPEGLALDPHTAVTLFFHDHDKEPPLLAHALRSPAFFVGAQGSLRAHQARCEVLRDLGLRPDELDRLASPFGLIPSARDPRTLAVSVLAHVLDTAMRSGADRS
ncbi:XdhC family protein [Paracoccus sediminicola]|uniref:XdhC family protein n=1 Tax=Paracoccus sediminicola TaxID=3017783 RepID=UPI0022F0E778|nr:XdhC family protein [Paracoccus sediminicola]WBU57367.1 XdhC family protein [Paracoccus sediminicola]